MPGWSMKFPQGVGIELGTWLVGSKCACRSNLSAGTSVCVSLPSFMRSQKSLQSLAPPGSLQDIPTMARVDWAAVRGSLGAILSKAQSMKSTRFIVTWPRPSVTVANMLFETRDERNRNTSHSADPKSEIESSMPPLKLSMKMPPVRMSVVISSKSSPASRARNCLPVCGENSGTWIRRE